MALNEDVKDIIFNYDHHLRFLPTLKMIKHTYRCSLTFAEMQCEALRIFGVDDDIVNKLKQEAMYAWYPFPKKWHLPGSPDHLPSHCRARAQRWKHLQTPIFGFLDKCVVDIDLDAWTGFRWQQNPRPITFEDKVLETRIRSRLERMEKQNTGHCVRKRNGPVFIMASEQEAWTFFNNLVRHPDRNSA